MRKNYVILGSFSVSDSPAGDPSFGPCMRAHVKQKQSSPMMPLMFQQLLVQPHVLQEESRL